MYCIYQITNKINGKRYIGQHMYEDESNPMGKYKGSGLLLRKAYKKYGIENFEIEILYKRVRDKATVDAMEIWAIEKYRPEYNIAKGGSGGDTYSGLSDSDKKRHNDNLSKALKGRKSPWAGWDKINEPRFWDACWNNWVKFNMSIIKRNDHFAYHKNRNKLSTYWNAYTEYYISIYKQKEHEEKVKNGYYKGMHKGFVSPTCWKKGHTPWNKGNSQKEE